MHKQPLLFPVGYWAQAPEHHLSVLAYAGASCVLTGGKEGEVILWETTNVDDKLAYVPQVMMLREGSGSISAIAALQNNELFVCASSEGYLSLWTARGRNLASNLCLPFAATELYPFARKQQWYIVCAGRDHRNVCVVQLATMTVVTVLVHNTNIVASTLHAPNHGTPTLFTVTENHVVHQWDFATAQAKQLELTEIITRLNATLLVADRIVQNTKLSATFVSSQAVDWFYTAGHVVDTREEALAVGQALLDAGLIRHIRNLPTFLDGDYLYQLVKTSPTEVTTAPARLDLGAMKPVVGGGGQAEKWVWPTSVLHLPLSLQQTTIKDMECTKDASRLFLVCDHEWFMLHTTTWSLLASGKPVPCQQQQQQQQGTVEAKTNWIASFTSNTYEHRAVKSLAKNATSQLRKISKREVLQHTPRLMRASAVNTPKSVQWEEWQGMAMCSNDKQFAVYASSGLVYIYTLNIDTTTSTGVTAWVEGDMPLFSATYTMLPARTLKSASVAPPAPAVERRMNEHKGGQNNTATFVTTGRRMRDVTKTEEEVVSSASAQNSTHTPPIYDIVSMTVSQDRMLLGYNDGMIRCVVLNNSEEKDDEKRRRQEEGVLSCTSDGFLLPVPPVAVTATSCVKDPDHRNMWLLRGYADGSLTMTSGLHDSGIRQIESPHTTDVLVMLVTTWVEPTTDRKTQQQDERVPIMITASRDRIVVHRLRDYSILHVFDTQYCPLKSVIWTLDPFDVHALDLPGLEQSASSRTAASDLLAAVCEDGCVRCWSLASKELVITLHGHVEPVTEVYCTLQCEARDMIVTETASHFYLFSLSTGGLLKTVQGEEMAALRLQYGLVSMNTQTGLSLKRRHIKRLVRRAHHSRKATNMDIDTSPLNTSLGVHKDNDETSPTELVPNSLHIVPKSSTSQLHLNMCVININRFIDELESVAYVTRDFDQQTVDVFGRVLALFFDWDASVAGVAHEEVADVHRTLIQRFHLKKASNSSNGQDAKNKEEEVVEMPSLPSFHVGWSSDNGQALSVLFPLNQSSREKGPHDLARWRFSPHLSACQSLALSSVCMSLLNAAPNDGQLQYSRIVAHYNVIVPDLLPNYYEPQVGILALYSLNHSRHVQSVALLLLQAVIERLCVDNKNPQTDEELERANNVVRKSKMSSRSSSLMEDSESTTTTPLRGMTMLVEEWCSFFHYKISHLDDAAMLTGDGNDKNVTPVTDNELMAAIVLTFVAAHERHLAQEETTTTTNEEGKRRGKSSSIASESKMKSKDLAAASAVAPYAIHLAYTLIRTVCNAKLTKAEPLKIALAAHLISKGYFLWRYYLTSDPVLLFRKLHHLSLSRNPAIADAAHRALLEAGKEAPKYFIRCMGKEALAGNNSAQCRSGALIAIVSLVRKAPHVLAKVLPAAVQIIVRCLDPSDPGLRKNLLLSSTAALHVLIQKYPMASFHQISQRFAVGTDAEHQHVIIIYDLRTATKWRILDGHVGAVSALAFNPDGSYLVSYSAHERPNPTVRAWNTAVSGFFSSLLGIQGRCTKIWKLDPNDDIAPQSMKAEETEVKRQLETIQLIWTSDNTVKLVRENRSEYNFGLD